MNNLLSNTESHLGLGCWSFGGSQWNGQSESDSLDALQTSFDLGIQHLDTAAGYGDGASEKVVGKFIADKRDQIYLATKGVLWGEQDPQLIIKCLEESLERLRVDYVDLYYIHWPNSNLDMRHMIEALETQRAAGKIKHLGVSNFSVSQLEQCREAGTIDALQHGYNLIWRKDEEEIMPYCRKHEIPLVTYSSLAQGILTGKFPRNPVFEGDDVRKDTAMFEPDIWPLVHSTMEEAKALAESVQRPLAHLAIQWALRQPGVRSVLIGARNAKQAWQNIEALKDPVDADVLKQLTSISDVLCSRLPKTSNIFRLDT